MTRAGKRVRWKDMIGGWEESRHRRDEIAGLVGIYISSCNSADWKAN